MGHPNNDARYRKFKSHVTNVYEHSIGLARQPFSITVDNDWIPMRGDDFESTDFAPGSPGKISVMIERLEKGQPLFHDLDRVGMESYDVDRLGALPITMKGNCRAELSLVLKSIEKEKED